MKKFLLFFLFLFVGGVVLVAQDIEPPTDWVDLLSQMPTWFGTLAGLAALSVFLGSIATSLFKITKSWGKQIVSWGVAILLCLIGNLVNFGILAEATWLQTIAYGLGAGLIANGIFDFTLVQLLLQYLKLEIKKPI